MSSFWVRARGVAGADQGTDPIYIPGSPSQVYLRAGRRASNRARFWLRQI